MRRLLCVIALVLLLLPFPAARAETGGPPAFTLTRSLSGEFIASGDWVALSYTVRNNSEYPITSVTVTDPLVGEVVQIDRLNAGESQTAVRRARIMADCESAPTARYALGGRMHSIAIASAAIRVERVALTVELQFETREEQAVLLTVTNGGNAPVFSVKAFDDALGDMGEAIEQLDPGEAASFRRAVHGGRHQCSVSAVSASGKALSLRSNELASRRADIPIVPEESASLSAERDEAGQIIVTLTNPSSETLRDVTLRELLRGDEQTLRFAPAESSTSVLWTPSEDAAGGYDFEALLDDGERLTASLAASEPNAAGATAAPVETTRGVPALNGPSFRMNESPQTYKQMLYITAAALFIFLIVWWVINHRRKRLARKKRLKQKHENRRKQQGKKNGEKAS